MSQAQDQNVNDLRIPTLERIAAGGQVWARVAEKHGVTNPLPPWKSSLDGTCDALDRNGKALPMLKRRGDEDLLSEAMYSTLPAPENQLVALAHSLVARGVIEEEALARRIAAIRARIASRCGASLGVSQSTVASRWAMRPPRVRTSEAAKARN